MAAEHRVVCGQIVDVFRVFTLEAISSPKGGIRRFPMGPPPPGRAQAWRGGCGPPQGLPFWPMGSSGVNLTPVKFRPIPVLWYLVDRLVPENA